MSHRIRNVSISYPHRIVSSHEELYRIVSYRIVIAIVSYRTMSLSYRIRIVSVSSHEPLYRIVQYRVASYRIVLLAAALLRAAAASCAT